MSAIKVTDLVAKSLDHLASADSAADPAVASRHERRAGIYSELAKAQSGKTANVISYLNSDRSKWSAPDEDVVRAMLGLHTLRPEGDSEGGAAAPAPEPAPEPVTPEPAPEPVADEPAPAILPSMDDAPSFMPDEEEAAHAY